MAKVAIGNEQRLYAKLGKMDDVIRARLHETMEEFADEVVQTMRAACPVEPGKPDLRDTIRWAWAPNPRSPGTLRIRFSVGTSELYYAPFLEFGTVKMSAQPFFLPSWRKHKAAMLAGMTEAVKTAIRQVAAGG